MSAKQRLIIGHESDEIIVSPSDGSSNNNSNNNNNNENANLVDRNYEKPSGMRLVYNRFVQFLLFCGLGSIIYIIYIHSVYLNKLVTREYVQAEGSVVNYSRSEFDYSYPTVYTVWINLKSNKLTDNQVKLLKKGDMVNLDDSLQCSSLENGHSPILSISLNFIGIDNSTTNHSSNGNHSIPNGGGNGTNMSNSDSYSNLYRNDGSSIYYSERNSRYLEDYSNYENYFYGSDYQMILKQYYSMNSNDSSLNDSNASIISNDTNYHHKNHTISYARDIVYMKSKGFGFLIVGMIFNSFFLMASYIVILKKKENLNNNSIFEKVYEHQIVIKHIYFPKCGMNKLFSSILITFIGVSTPLYFIGSILPFLAYDLDNDSGDLCMIINENLVFNENHLEMIFNFQFWFVIVGLGVFVLSYCLPEEHKRDSWQKSTIMLMCIVMAATLIIGVLIATTMKLDILIAYAIVGGVYVLAFILQIFMY